MKTMRTPLTDAAISALKVERGNDVEYVAQHVDGRLRRIDVVHHFRAVEIEDRFRLVIVRIEAAANDLQIRVVQAVFTQRTALQPRDHLAHIRAGEMKNGAHIKGLLEDGGLARVPR